ncbi:hypothetical protein MPDQ_003780 [Monascus purpureus]|uniref:Sedoheptulose 1,7-bisphosphatase n=1 Tax=Monascus purpureus TaxID=5098 RepID=A0A507QMK4_MONPU|nr:hypothetical protein MPDQ_003780 [Monascus purpureus]
MSSRIYLVRHGATEWSKNGKHTSTSDIPLTAAGEKEVLETRDAFVGPGKLIDPDKIARIYCSPRGRARRTAELLNLGIHEHQHFQLREGADGITTTEKDDPSAKTIHVTPLIQEWDYGDYEGLTIEEVHKLRKQKGQHNGRNWSIWKDSCPGGETPQQVSDRLDELIKEIKSVIAGKSAEYPGDTRIAHHATAPKDIVCVAHGHILAAFAIRWVDQPLKNGTRLLNEPCGVAVLGFEHDDLEEPAIIMGQRPGH